MQIVDPNWIEWTSANTDVACRFENFSNNELHGEKSF